MIGHHPDSVILRPVTSMLVRRRVEENGVGRRPVPPPEMTSVISRKHVRPCTVNCVTAAARDVGAERQVPEPVRIRVHRRRHLSYHPDRNPARNGRAEPVRRKHLHRIPARNPEWPAPRPPHRPAAVHRLRQSYSSVPSRIARKSTNISTD